MTVTNLLRTILLVSGLVLAAEAPARAPEPPAVGLDDADYQNGEALARRGDFAAALPRLAGALARHPDSADAHSMMGYVLRNLKRFEEAEAHYRKALSLRPDHPGALEYYGELLLLLDRAPAAREVLRTLERSCPAGCEELRDLEAAFRKAGVDPR